MSEPSWWLRDPSGRRAHEEDALRAAGIPWRRVAPTEVGDLYAVDVDVPGLEGDLVTLRAKYPPFFPFFPPLVGGQGLGLQHHWAKTSGLLCLSEPGGKGWRADDTLADLLTEQWPRVLEVNTGDGRSASGELLETVQAEPWTAYLTPEPGWLAITDSDLVPPVGATGPAAFRADLTAPGHRLFLTAVAREGGEIVEGSTPQTFREPDLPQLQGRWVGLDEVPEKPDADSLFAAARFAAPELDQGPWLRMPAGGNWEGGPKRQLQLIALHVPVETGHRIVGGGWVVLARTRSAQGKKPGRSRLVKVEYAGRRDLYRRAPELEPVQDKTVLIVGGGGLGSEVYTLVAELGLRKLIIADGDVVDAATAVRMRSAFRFAGVQKAAALAQLALETQPYTQLQIIPLTLGLLPNAADDTLHETFAVAVNEADLVIDCTANLNVQNMLAATLRAAGRAYMYAEAMPGVYSGRIVLLPSSSDICWECVQLHIGGAMPVLPSSPTSDVAHPGCLEPTYPGTGFDLTAIACQAVSTAVAHLLGGAGWDQADVTSVVLREADGRRVLPRWERHDLSPHPACKGHAPNST